MRQKRLGKVPGSSDFNALSKNHRGEGEGAPAQRRGDDKRADRVVTVFPCDRDKWSAFLSGW